MKTIVMAENEEKAKDKLIAILKEKQLWKLNILNNTNYFKDDNNDEWWYISAYKNYCFTRHNIAYIDKDIPKGRLKYLIPDIVGLPPKKIYWF